MKQTLFLVIAALFIVTATGCPGVDPTQDETLQSDNPDQTDNPLRNLAFEREFRQVLNAVRNDFVKPSSPGVINANLNAIETNHDIQLLSTRMVLPDAHFGSGWIIDDKGLEQPCYWQDDVRNELPIPEGWHGGMTTFIGIYGYLFRYAPRDDGLFPKIAEKKPHTFLFPDQKYMAYQTFKYDEDGQQIYSALVHDYTEDEFYLGVNMTDERLVKFREGEERGEPVIGLKPTISCLEQLLPPNATLWSYYGISWLDTHEIDGKIYVTGYNVYSYYLEGERYIARTAFYWFDGGERVDLTGVPGGDTFPVTYGLGAQFWIDVIDGVTYIGGFYSARPKNEAASSENPMIPTYWADGVRVIDIN